MCRCGHAQGFHNPCSICECSAFEQRRTVKGESNAKKYARRSTR